MELEFQDKTVVVTGGTRGIGRAVSLHFAGLGARVFAAYKADEESARAIEEEGAGLAGSIVAVKADVASGVGAQALIAEACAGGNRLDILVNNAGIVRDCFLAMMSDGDWDDVLHNNVGPLFHCCKWGVRKMLAGRKGAIVNLSSVSAYLGTPGQTNYAASKGAVLGFTKSLSREVGPMGIRVNAVAPGLVQTDMLAAMKKEHVDRIVAGAALARVGRGEEIAEAVAFLASDRASYITGQCLVVDGGLL